MARKTPRPRDGREKPDPPSGRVLPPARELAAIETRRSRLPASRTRDPDAWRRGFEYFATAYGPAMQQFVGALLRGRVHPSRDRGLSEEIVQGYLADCMAKDWLAPKAGPIRSFRAFIKSQLRAFTENHLDHVFAARRDPRRIGLVDPRDLASDAGDPADAAFDRSLVDIAVHRTLERLRRVSADGAEVIADLLRTDNQGSPDILERIGRRGARLRDVRARAQRNFAALFRRELAATVHDDADLALLLDELDSLLP